MHCTTREISWTLDKAGKVDLNTIMKRILFLFSPLLQQRLAPNVTVRPQPWTRVSPYLVGLAAGWAAHRLVGLRSRLDWTAVRVAGVGLAWAAATSLALALVYGVYQADLGLAEVPGRLHTVLGRAAWSVSLAWLTLACLAGWGGPLDWLLSLPPLRPLSRLTYSAYLLHPLVILYQYRNLETALHASLPTIAWLYTANLALAYAAALLFSLVFEAPFMNLQKIFGI